MRHWKATLAILAAFSASIVPADDFKTINGKEYKDVTVSRVEADGIVLRTKGGISKVYFAELPKEVQERFHYVDPAKLDAERAAKAAAEQRAREAEKAQAEERAKEREEKRAQESAEKEREALAILTKTKEQFEAAESRAVQSYQSSEKGTLSGQVFVATKGGENVKLGARQTSLFGREAVAILAVGLKAFAAAKSEQLQLGIAAAQENERQAEAAEEQANAAGRQVDATEEQANVAEERAKAEEQQANEAEQRAKVAETMVNGPRASDSETAFSAAREAAKQARERAQATRQAAKQAREAGNRARSDRLRKTGEAADAAREAADAARRRIDSLSKEKAYYYSDQFLFSQLRSPIQTAETDAEGKFTIPVPRTGAWVIGTQAERSVGQDTERYYWLQPVSLEGQSQRVQNLSNTNVGGASGISPLIFTYP